MTSLTHLASWQQDALMGGLLGLIGSSLFMTVILCLINQAYPENESEINNQNNLEIGKVP